MNEPFPAYLAWVFQGVWIVSVAALFAAVVSIISAIRRRWAMTIRLSRLSVVVSVAVLVGSPLLLGFVYSRTVDDFSADGSSKAAVLAQAISEVMNCTAFAPVALLIGGISWMIGFAGERRTDRGVDADDAQVER